MNYLQKVRLVLRWALILGYACVPTASVFFMKAMSVPIPLWMSALIGIVQTMIGASLYVICTTRGEA